MVIINRYVPSAEVFKNIGTNIDKNVNNKNESVSSVSFADTLKQSLDKINDKQITADNYTDSFIKGDDVDIADVMLKTEEAKMSLQLAVQIRNKLLDAYTDISNIQV